MVQLLTSLLSLSLLFELCQPLPTTMMMMGSFVPAKSATDTTGGDDGPVFPTVHSMAHESKTAPEVLHEDPGGEMMPADKKGIPLTVLKQEAQHTIPLEITEDHPNLDEITLLEREMKDSPTVDAGANSGTGGGHEQGGSSVVTSEAWTNTGKKPLVIDPNQNGSGKTIKKWRKVEPIRRESSEVNAKRQIEGGNGPASDGIPGPTNSTVQVFEIEIQSDASGKSNEVQTIEIEAQTPFEFKYILDLINEGFFSDDEKSK